MYIMPRVVQIPATWRVGPRLIITSAWSRLVTHYALTWHRPTRAKSGSEATVPIPHPDHLRTLPEKFARFWSTKACGRLFWG